MILLVGKKIASKILAEIKKGISAEAAARNKPVLAVITVGGDAVGERYVALKEKAAKAVGIKVKRIKLGRTVGQDSLIARIKKLNEDDGITGIVVQLPLPKRIDLNKVIWSIDPRKDVDGFQMREYRPPAPTAIIKLLLGYSIPVEGSRIVLVGAGVLVGKPLYTLLRKQGAKVDLITRSTARLNLKLTQADVIISACGSPGLIKGSMVKPEQVVIDAGVSSLGNKLAGDVDYKTVSKVVKAITPPVGGVGPLTVALLLKNVYRAYKKQLARETQQLAEGVAAAGGYQIKPFVRRKK